LFAGRSTANFSQILITNSQFPKFFTFLCFFFTFHFSGRPWGRFFTLKKQIFHIKIFRADLPEKFKRLFLGKKHDISGIGAQAIGN
jgi:hypothetical protein